MVLRGKLIVFEEPVELLEMPPMEGDYRLRLQDGLVQLEFITLRQGPQKASQSFDLATLLEDLQEREFIQELCA